jgi:hypothetical protein
MACLAALGVTANGLASDYSVKAHERAASNAYRGDKIAIYHAVRQLQIGDPTTGQAAIDTGLTLTNDMKIQHALLASTPASTRRVRAGRTLLLQGLTALAAAGDYLARYGQAVEASASAPVWQADSNSYLDYTREGETLAERGAALMGLPFL